MGINKKRPCVLISWAGAMTANRFIGNRVYTMKDTRQTVSAQKSHRADFRWVLRRWVTGYVIDEVLKYQATLSKPKFNGKFKKNLKKT
ncbi:MAG: hypothetical protein CV082_09150 [Candidatus Brocadia sp. BL1]|nr:MAG: hypothetical protein CV082_09150 [Candidatus Brocadia sp. BL1]